MYESPINILPFLPRNSYQFKLSKDYPHKVRSPNRKSITAILFPGKSNICREKFFLFIGKNFGLLNDSNVYLKQAHFTNFHHCSQLNARLFSMMVRFKCCLVDKNEINPLAAVFNFFAACLVSHLNILCCDSIDNLDCRCYIQQLAFIGVSNQ